MKNPEIRRRSSRHPVRWKAAVVFDSAEGKPAMHTQTVDLSASGAAIFSERGDLTGSVVNLLLAQPAQQGGEAPKVLKARARVVSTVRTPGMAQYRHGLSFVRTSGDGLEALEAFLSAAAPAAAAGAPAAVSRLARLKQLAQTHALQGEPLDPQEASNAQVSGALEKAYRYLKELAEQLNAVRPTYRTGYGIVGVPEFGGLAWEEGSADFHMREISPAVRLFDRVSLQFRLSGKKQLEVAREYPAAERLQQLLEDSGIEFHARGSWNKRGSLERTTFMFPCEVKASLVLQGQYDTGKLLLRARNVAGFGTLEQILAPAAVTEDALDELAGLILGETGAPGPLLLRGA